MPEQPVAAGSSGLQFGVHNHDDQPVIYTTAQPGQNDLVVTMTNATSVPLLLRGGAPVAEPPPATGPTALYLTIDLLTAAELQAMTVSAAGWQAAPQAGPPACWALTPVEDVTLAAGATVTFTVANISASARPQPGTLAVDYYNVPRSRDNAWEATMFLQNPPNNRKTLVLTPEIDSSLVLISSDDFHTIANQTGWSLSNPEKDAPLVPEDVPWGTDSPMFTVSFVYGQAPGYGALTTADRAAKIGVDPVNLYGNDWVVTPELLGPRTRWTLEPKNHSILGAGDSATVEFMLDNVVTELQPGTTQMYVQHTGIPGYEDGYITFALRKVRPIAITSMAVVPSWIEPTDPPATLSVQWQIDGEAWAELTSTDRLDLVNTHSPYTAPGVSHPVEFTLHATAKAPGNPPALAKADFGIVTFTENATAVTLWHPVNSGACPTRGVAFSSKWNRAYVTGLNLPNDGLLWVVDRGSNSVGTPVSLGRNAFPNALVLAGGVSDGERLYLASTNAILAIDMSAAGTVTKVQPVAIPDGFANDWQAPFCVSPDGRFIYAGLGSGVVMFDAANGFTRWSLWGDGTPTAAVTISPDGTRLYVLGDHCRNVTVIDLVARQVVVQFPTGQAAGEGTESYPRLAVHPNGRQLYATGVHPGELTAISLADDGRTIMRIPVGKELRDVRVSPDGTLVCVACGGDGTAAVIDPAQNIVRRRWDDPFRRPIDAFDEAIALAVDEAAIGILRVQSSGGRLSLIDCTWEPLPLHTRAESDFAVD